MAAEEVATCVLENRSAALTYLTDGNFKSTILNGTAIGQGRLVPKGADHYAIESQNENESLYAYPLQDGRMVVIAWSVDSRGADFPDPSFRAKVLRMELLAANGDRLSTYGNCRNIPR